MELAAGLVNDDIFVTPHSDCQIVTFPLASTRVGTVVGVVSYARNDA